MGDCRAITPFFMPPSSAGPASLGQLLSMSYAFSMAHWKAILIGAVAFGTIGALIQGVTQMKAVGEFGQMMEEEGLNVEQMEELGRRMQAGDEDAAAELQALLEQQMGDTEEEQEEFGRKMGLGVLNAALPVVIVALIVSFLLTVFASAYYLSITFGAADAQVAMGRAASLFFPLVGMWIWILLRSFIWIPLLGLIPAIILGPRFVLAPVIMVQEKKGIMQSVSESYSRTQGYWAKIFGNMIVMALCMFVVSIVASIVGGFLGLVSPYATLWVVSVAKYALKAYAVVFVVQLSLTLMQNPMAKRAQV